MPHTYNIMLNVGTAKYVVNYCTGEKTHSDGSFFFDMAIFSNKRKANVFIRSLQRQGYTGNGTL